jgi:hypothetical protein
MPCPEHPYFIFDGQGDQFMYFKTESERDNHAKTVISAYMNDGWDEEVTEVVAGKLTHTTIMTNKVDRPDSIDEDDYDQDGQYWDPDWSYRCNYELLKLGVDSTTPDSSRLDLCDDSDCVGCDSMEAELINTPLVTLNN